MARAFYGCTSADYTLTAGGRLSPGAVLTLWTARTGGTRITDLLTVDGTPITEVVSGADASIAYQGPDNDKSVHWADSGQGARTAIRPVDITGAVGPTGDVGPIGPPGASGGVLTTKGDLLVRDSGAGVRLPVGADNRVLTADASQAAGMRWATPTTRVGTGSPLNLVVPDFVGQEFVDTLQTLGARKWVATGTTAASWVVSDGDTGFMPWTTWTAAGVVTGAALPADWQPYAGQAGGVWLRRINQRVLARIEMLQATPGTSFLQLPVGWRPDISRNMTVPMMPTTGSQVPRTWQAAGPSLGRGSNSLFTAGDWVYSIVLEWTTANTWP